MGFKIKIGDKCKIPKTKNVGERYDESYAIRKAKELNQDFLYYTGKSKGGDHRLYHIYDENDLTGDYFLEHEIELYEEEFSEKWWIYPKTISEIEAVCKWFDKNHTNEEVGVFYSSQKRKTGYTNAFQKGNVYFEHKPKEATEITFDQFKKHILKEETTMKNLLETEFVIENCTLSQRLAIKAYCDEKKIRIYEDSFNLRSCKSYPNLRFDKTLFVGTTNLNAKVITFSELIQFLDQYQPEPEFKVGDFVSFVFSDRVETKLLKTKSGNGFFDSFDSWVEITCKNYRHATSEEIKKWKEENEIKLPRINGYDGLLYSIGINTMLKWGCTEISISTVKELLNAGVDHITIKGNHVLDFEIKQIKKFIEHNKL